MGRAERRRPARMAEKLLALREHLGLSQNELIARMGLLRTLRQSDISSYELGKREPPLEVLLRYARAAGGRRGAGGYLEMIIDDELDLKLPECSQRKVRAEKISGKGRSTSHKSTGR